MPYTDLLHKQRQFFATGKTLPLEFRLEQLKKLKALVQSHEKEISQALKLDLNRSATDSYLTEIMPIIDDIDLALKSLKKWMRPKKTATPFPLLWPGRSEIHYEPYGVVLNLAPWNYPFSLSIQPLVAIIAAGNCAVVKPSEVSAHTQKLVIDLISQTFSKEYIAAIAADPEETKKLLEEKFDYIIFTGGTQIGKIVMAAAAKHLTPVTLELGGKSPCIVDQTADLAYAASRITLGKFLNAGQTCIAPDYILVHKSCKDELAKKIEAETKRFYSDDPLKSESYGRIINTKQFDRLSKLLQKGRILFGGQSNREKQYIAPTLIDQISWGDPIMQEEIFGPVLPILTYDSIEEVTEAVKAGPKPLAFYYFTKDEVSRDRLLSQISFGGGCINDCIMHYLNPNLPFGGVGNSGMGTYHGKFGFETFSHRKSVFRKTWFYYPGFTYPPHTEKKFRIIKKLLK